MKVYENHLYLIEDEYRKYIVVCNKSSTIVLTGIIVETYSTVMKASIGNVVRIDVSLLVPFGAYTCNSNADLKYIHLGHKDSHPDLFI